MTKIMAHLSFDMVFHALPAELAWLLSWLVLSCFCHACMGVPLLGHTPSTAGTFRKKSGKTPETLSERFLEFPSRVRLGCPKPSISRLLRLPERFQNFLPPSTAGNASFFRIGPGEGLSELVMEFPAVPGAFLNISDPFNHDLRQHCFPLTGYPPGC